MNTCYVILYLLLVFLHLPYTRACNHIYAGQPIYGYSCISSDNSVVRLWQTAQPQCVWKCLRLETCLYINHNYDTGTCDLGFSKCESLAPMVGSTIRAFGPPRETCLQPQTGICNSRRTRLDSFVCGTNGRRYHFGCWKVRHRHRDVFRQ